MADHQADLAEQRPAARPRLADRAGGSGALPGLTCAAIEGGLLVQNWDRLEPDPAAGQVATARAPTEAERSDLDFAWRVCACVKSNAIVLARDGQLVGVGAGQMSRLDSVRIAVEKAGARAAGSVLASDAFFPFRDGPDLAAARRRHGHHPARRLAPRRQDDRRLQRARHGHDPHRPPPLPALSKCWVLSGRHWLCQCPRLPRLPAFCSSRHASSRAIRSTVRSAMSPAAVAAAAEAAHSASTEPATAAEATHSAAAESATAVAAYSAAEPPHRPSLLRRGWPAVVAAEPAHSSGSGMGGHAPCRRPSRGRPPPPSASRRADPTHARAVHAAAASELPPPKPWPPPRAIGTAAAGTAERAARPAKSLGAATARTTSTQSDSSSPASSLVLLAVRHPFEPDESSRLR